MREGRPGHGERPDVLGREAMGVGRTHRRRRAHHLPAITVAIPASALRLFLHLLSEMSQGNAVTLIPPTPSGPPSKRPTGSTSHVPTWSSYQTRVKIPCWTAGKHRRVRPDDRMADKRKDDEARAKILDQLQAEVQELPMGY
jgi:hypothetical protein